MAARKKAEFPGTLESEGTPEKGYRWKWTSPKGDVSFSPTKYLSKPAATAAGKAFLTKKFAPEAD